jgi:hypothetical protein
VAGIWKLEVRRRVPTITLDSKVRLKAATRKELVAEAERVARALHPDAQDVSVSSAG